MSEVSVPRPVDAFRVISLVMLTAVGAIVALPVVIGLVVGMVFLGSMMSLLGMGAKAGAGGCSPLLLMMMLLRGGRGPQEQIPRLDIRLRDGSGKTIDAVAIGHLKWPAPVVGDDLVVAGPRHRGVLEIRRGKNLSTGVDMKVPSSRWRLVFFLLLGLQILGFSLTYLSDTGGLG